MIISKGYSIKVEILNNETGVLRTIYADRPYSFNVTFNYREDFSGSNGFVLDVEGTAKYSEEYNVDKVL